MSLIQVIVFLETVNFLLKDHFCLFRGKVKQGTQKYLTIEINRYKKHLIKNKLQNCFLTHVRVQWNRTTNVLLVRQTLLH